jgi:hypothetical protein
VVRDDADAVWNRACEPRRFPSPGDDALSALLLLHGMAMNGGLLHAVEGLTDDELDRGVQAFRYLDLREAADAVERIAREARVLDASDVDAADSLELAADEAYRTALPEDDETIDRAFCAHFAQHPYAYAPSGSTS